MSRARVFRVFLAGALAAAVPLTYVVHSRVGSGHGCEGIGFGCTPERLFDTWLVALVYAACATATGWLISRSRLPPWRVVAIGGAITLAAVGVATAAQGPDYRHAEGDLQQGLREWQAIIDAGREAARPGTPLAAALAGLRRTGPESCLDGYGRATGASRYRWTFGPEPYDDPANGTTAPALLAWESALRTRGLPATYTESGDAQEDVDLALGYGPARANGGALKVRGAHYIPELEIHVSTGCHRP